MRIAIGSDHAGFHLKNSLVAVLEQMGHSVVDKGTHSDQAVDYPDYAEARKNPTAALAAAETLP